MDWSDRIGRRIKLRDLHILMAVADTGSNRWRFSSRDVQSIRTRRSSYG